MHSSKVAPAASALLFVALTAAAVAYARHVPEVVPASAPLSMFSAQRAFVDVAALGGSPAVVGRARNTMAREYIETQLQAAGVPFQEQHTVAAGTRNGVAGPVVNIVARIPGSQPGGPAVLLMAHYDAVPVSPGAGDDGSGCAVLLETLRALRASVPLRHDVIALFTDGEEAGLLGAAGFAREHPWARDAAVVLNFEARGTSGPSLMFETGPGNLDVVRVLRRVPGARATSLSTAVYRRMPNDTDLSEFAALGLPALNFAFIGGVERYHTAEDDISHLDAKSVQHHGNSALALARMFASGELPRPRTSDAVFFDLPGVGLVVYPESWALWFAGAAVLIVLVVLRRTRARSPQLWRGALLGFALTLGAAIAAAAAGGLVAALLQCLHGMTASGRNPAWSDVYALAIAVMAVAIASAGLALARRFSDASAVMSGVLLFWAILTVLTAVALPAASYLFTWPTIAMAAALLVRDRWPRGATSVTTWIAAAMTVLIVVPVLYLMAYVALGVDVAGAVILGTLTSLAASLSAPILEDIGSARMGRVAIGAAVVSVAFFITGAVTLRTGDRHPGAADLIHAVDADSNTAWLTGYAYSPSARQALLGVLRRAAQDRPQSAQPPAWAGRPFGDESMFEVPSLHPEPPAATVVSDAVSNGVRRVSLRIRAGSGQDALD